MRIPKKSPLSSVFTTLIVSAAIGCGVLATIPVIAYDGKKEVSHAEAMPGRQYTFSWKFSDGDAMAPRGGTSKGAPVTLATGPSTAWLRLQEPGLSEFERDRRAILAMAGEYRVSFDFIEVAGFESDYEPKQPYQSWGTEKIYVIEDRGDFISMQHLLVTRMIGDDGKATDPVVTKHWRQDWQFKPGNLFAYRGDNTWQNMPVAAKDGEGAWRQSVFQVDDSPRYSGVGRWQHFGNYSTWIGGEVWRPLPRREYSVRDDYQVLVGTNRHTITPTGWVHEQQNNKVALDAAGSPRSDRPVVGREFGFNRYEHIQDFDFAAGDHYLTATEALWRAVRDEWNVMLARAEPVRLKGAPDRDRMFIPLFEMAEQLNATQSPAAFAAKQLQNEARAKVRAYLAPVDAAIASR
jgi:hypothetical protein